MSLVILPLPRITWLVKRIVRFKQTVDFFDSTNTHFFINIQANHFNILK